MYIFDYDLGMYRYFKYIYSEYSWIRSMDTISFALSSAAWLIMLCIKKCIFGVYFGPMRKFM